MQILASKKVYMFFYGAIGIIKVSQNFRYLFTILCRQNVVCFGLGASPAQPARIKY